MKLLTYEEFKSLPAYCMGRNCLTSCKYFVKVKGYQRKPLQITCPFIVIGAINGRLKLVPTTWMESELEDLYAEYKRVYNLKKMGLIKETMKKGK